MSGKKTSAPCYQLILSSFSHGWDCQWCPLTNTYWEVEFGSRYPQGKSYSNSSVCCAMCSVFPWLLLTFTSLQGVYTQTPRRFCFVQVGFWSFSWHDQLYYLLKTPTAPLLISSSLCWFLLTEQSVNCVVSSLGLSTAISGVMEWVQQRPGSKWKAEQRWKL